MTQEPTQIEVSPATAEDRAKASHGSSGEKIYRLVDRVVREIHQGRGTLVDVGCGAGELRNHLLDLVDLYIGADIIRYDGLPADAVFHPVNLDTGRIDLDDESADLVVCVETIEHVENPRALVRELVRLARPGAWIVMTTPNQLSLLSKMCLVLKNEFSAFQERPGLYPSHISALLATDLIRIARENGLVGASVRYTGAGRIPGTPWSWPSFMGGRAFSDNVLLMARKSPKILA